MRDNIRRIQRIEQRINPEQEARAAGRMKAARLAVLESMTVDELKTLHAAMLAQAAGHPLTADHLHAINLCTERVRAQMAEPG